ncbi:DUF2975 domain-containing protein [Aurantiacibacter aquimixticola]|uniref:DUF2975 domain-containing protein n=1 Tax=Aurantiacibacter aquimixticola TaxID=1958945 RepID=A0A419RVF7_9SPHN|nr:DUF2975 domain-containing protein [Aurantiacibacter aquimixticola]RJY09760.1 DUF2975 domain-containing protein [Aurantiacibacter aquimixticola]
MTEKRTDPLLLAGKAITIFMQGVTGLAAAALLIAMPVLYFWRDDISAELATELGPQAGDFPLGSALAVIALALIAVGIIFVFFGRLRRIIDTVGHGDPFAPENADRLNVMAWLLLAVQLIQVPIMGIGLMVAKWADEVGHDDITIDAGIDLTGILMVIVLFILARVFKLGARMREDLEGTV